MFWSLECFVIKFVAGESLKKSAETITQEKKKGLMLWFITFKAIHVNASITLLQVCFRRVV